jgi:hypothetical protein
MSTADPPPKPTRRWYQYGLKTLKKIIALLLDQRTPAMKSHTTWTLPLVLLLVVGTPGLSAETDGGQEVAISAIKKLGGTVKLDRNKAAIEVTLDGIKVTDTALIHLKGMTDLTFLYIGHTSVSDAGLARLKGLTNLQELYLDSNNVTGTGLKHLKGLTKLHNLSLNSTQVTDAGLRDLKGLTSLQTLDLSSTIVTDAILKEIKGLTKLRVLRLRGCGGVTDTGLGHLKGLTKLEFLDISYARVTNAGLKQLVGLKSLRRLELQSEKVTDAGVKKLQQALPKCRIRNIKGLHK